MMIYENYWRSFRTNDTWLQSQLVMTKRCLSPTTEKIGILAYLLLLRGSKKITKMIKLSIIKQSGLGFHQARSPNKRCTLGWVM
ncbi:hypothetical protein CEXT_656021 [Caerostris extrusa]|uniref:Uncharacterized protein n=1 Tax=Caerostris extrusa TaxID=172846 RepID=A0AAV4Y5C1_CAEEX|nr:hypothetical protein CEXT_656021 [Caerostris extrusa]